MSLQSLGEQLLPSPDLKDARLKALFPFFFSIDRQLLAVEIGPSLSKILPGFVPGSPLSNHFTLDRPHVALKFSALCDEAHSLFLLRQVHSRFLLRGQILPNPAQNQILFLCSPWLLSSGSLQALGLSLADFALHDPMPEFVQIAHSNRLALDDLGRLSANLQEQRQSLREAKARLETALATECASRKKVENQLQTQNAQIATMKGQVQAYLANAGPGRRFLLDLEDNLTQLLSEQQAAANSDSRFKVVELLNDLAHFLRPLAEAKGVSISISARSVEQALLGDRNQLYTLLLTLCHNAIKFTNLADLAITAEKGSGDLVIFKVMDTGKGIPPAKVAQIHHAFSRPKFSAPRLMSPAPTQGHTEQAEAHTGLGLALAKQLVDLMRGSIEVVSTSGQGTLFTVTLPLPQSTVEDSTADVPRRYQAALLPPKTLRPAKRRVVSLDVQVLLLQSKSPPDNNRFPVLLLEQEGCRVDVADSSEDALAMIEYAQYDLILLDCAIPNEAAFITASRIRAAEADPENKIPILGFAPHLDEETLRLCSDAGMDDCLPSPPNAQQLKLAITRWSRPTN